MPRKITRSSVAPRRSRRLNHLQVNVCEKLNVKFSNMKTNEIQKSVPAQMMFPQLKMNTADIKKKHLKGQLSGEFISSKQPVQNEVLVNSYSNAEVIKLKNVVVSKTDVNRSQKIDLSEAADLTVGQTSECDKPTNVKVPSMKKQIRITRSSCKLNIEFISSQRPIQNEVSASVNSTVEIIKKKEVSTPTVDENSSQCITAYDATAVCDAPCFQTIPQVNSNTLYGQLPKYNALKKKKGMYVKWFGSKKRRRAVKSNIETDIKNTILKNVRQLSSKTMNGAGSQQRLSSKEAVKNWLRSTLVSVGKPCKQEGTRVTRQQSLKNTEKKICSDDLCNLFSDFNIASESKLSMEFKLRPRNDLCGVVTSSQSLFGSSQQTKRNSQQSTRTFSVSFKCRPIIISEKERAPTNYAEYLDLTSILRSINKIGRRIPSYVPVEDNCYEGFDLWN